MVTDEISKPTLLIVDDDPLIQEVLGDFFVDEFEVFGAHNRDEVKSILTQIKKPIDYALVDLGLPPTPHRPDEGFSVIGILQAKSPRCAIVVVSGQDGRLHAQRARALGAGDYAEKPIQPPLLKEKLFQTKKTQKHAFQAMGLVGNSKTIQALREQIRLIATVPYPVLVVGESGVGKELVAQALHNEGRPSKPFLAINCAAIPEYLVEPTLFGHTQGAFTGAKHASAGYLGNVADGTLLLDEVSALPETVQPKLLRVLEMGEYQRVGESITRQCTARIVAASNQIHNQGSIRDDLYYRLSVFTIVAPPLRELDDDRNLLLKHYRQAIATDLSLPIFELTADAKLLWQNYKFPGNVRELKNIIARLQVKHPGQVVDETTLRQELSERFTQSEGQLVESPIQQIAWRLAKDVVLEALRKSNGNISVASKALSIKENDVQTLLEIS